MASALLLGKPAASAWLLGKPAASAWLLGKPAPSALLLGKPARLRARDWSELPRVEVSVSLWREDEKWPWGKPAASAWPWGMRTCSGRRRWMR